MICKICGKEENPEHYVEKAAKQLKKHQMCFTCNHWRLQHELDLTKRGKYGYAIINGEHYVLEKHTDGPFKGCCGAEFTIKFKDGHVEKCDNLWCQGKIDEDYWKALMPNNAEFVENNSNHLKL